MVQRTFYDQMLLERSARPKYKGSLSEATIRQTLQNASCGDTLTIGLRKKEDKIVDGRWSGTGCAIAQASADLMIEAMLGKTEYAASKMRENFLQMIVGEKEFTEEELGNLVALKSVARMPARFNCAMLAWKILDEAAEE